MFCVTLGGVFGVAMLYLCMANELTLLTNGNCYHNTGRLFDTAHF